MAQTNGSAAAGIARLPKRSTDTAVFVIGGDKIQVPALTLATIDKVVDELKSLGPALWWVDYSRNCLRIAVAALEDTQPELTYDVLAAACSMGEMRKMPFYMSDLHARHGFLLGEALASEENPGTSTPTPSPPNSPPRESAAETSTG